MLLAIFSSSNGKYTVGRLSEPFSFNNFVVFDFLLHVIDEYDEVICVIVKEFSLNI